MEQSSAPDEDDLDSRPTGLLEAPRALREASGVVENEIDPMLLEKLKPVDDLLARLETANYYELLGVATDASPQDIRRAYSQLAKRFHPDVYFRKRIGAYQRKLEQLFAALTRAYGVLQNSDERMVYDLITGIPRAARASSAVIDRVPVSIAPAPLSMRPEPPRVTTAPPAARIESRPSPRNADQAREALRRELNRRNSMPPRENRAASLDALITELERTPTVQGWVTSRLREVRNQERNGDFRAAFNMLQLVLTRFSDARLAELRDQLRERLVRSEKPRK
jgi:hypothetical protein